MALPSVSWAQNPSLDQYVESVPTSHGDRSPQGGAGGGSNGGHNGGNGGSTNGGTSLPPQTREQLQQQAGGDAAALEAVATNPGLGAPSKGDGGKGHESTGRTGTGTGSGATSGANSPGAVDAVATAATGGDGSTGPWLLAAIAALTGLTLAAALMRRRSSPPTA
jgi:hypothetical protein